jgi:outer membrane protein assembly complex protein YaeT
MNSLRAIWLIIFWCLLLGFALPSTGAEKVKKEKTKPAKIKVSGYGFLGNRELKRILTTLELAGKKPEFFGPSFIEDSALVLTARVKHDGYLGPDIQIDLTLADGQKLHVNAADLVENPLPRPLRVKETRYQIRKGVLFHFATLEFKGLKSIPEKQARSYFVETEILFNNKRARIFTPERLRQGIASLTDILDRQGYREAKITAGQLQQDAKTGAVQVRIDVQEGTKFIVHSVREEFLYDRVPKPEETKILLPNKPYSRLWLQDFMLSLKTNLFQKGYPDTTVDVQSIARNAKQDQIEVDLLAKIESGSQIRIGSVQFQGEKRTREHLMSRRVRIQRGELLDPTRVEEGRYRLAKLGIFNTVDLDYRGVDEHTRDVIYRVNEGKTLNLSLLLGWGSYELLRGGVDVEAFNIWGSAHHAELKAIQSFKATSGDLTYTIPEVLPNDIDLFLNGNGLRREESSFTRLEYGGGVGLHKYFQSSSTDVSTRYNYQILNALNFSSIQEISSEGLTNPAVGSIITEIKHDRRDNPLYPRHGYKVFLTLETATSYLGGDANYQRVELSTSWHLPLGGGRYLGLGLSHGLDVSFGSSSNNLPFNKRFFPGGGNSIRGYQEGEASPRNEFNQFVGAETYTLGTVELEQALTPKWSIVIFSDSLGFARRISDYPFDTGLFSVGAGLRWRTLIGPIRLEYGYNLNPRPGDPSGTVQFTLGFPF